MENEIDRYASRHPPVSRSVQDNLMIDLFAIKHDMTIEQVEVALMKVEKKEGFMGGPKGKPQNDNT
jgi:hypothetical protein